MLVVSHTLEGSRTDERRYSICYTIGSRSVNGSACNLYADISWCVISRTPKKCIAHSTCKYGTDRLPGVMRSLTRWRNT